MRSLAERLRRLADDAADRPALISWLGGREDAVTWRELNERSARRAVELSVGAVDPFLIVRASNDTASVVELLAALRAGLPVVPLDPRSTDAEREHIARQLRSVPSGALAGVSHLLVTSGSTGLPKLVTHHAAVGYDRRQGPDPILRRADWHAGQCQLVVLPLHHAAGFRCFLDGVWDGNTLVLKTDVVATEIWDMIIKYRVDWALLTPTHMRVLLPSAPEPAALHTPLSVLHTGAPCAPDLKRAWIRLLGAERVHEMYGSTEGIGATVIRGDEWLQRPGSVGRAVCAQVRILDDRQAVLPPRTVGDVYFRTPGRGRDTPRRLGGRPAATSTGFVSVGDRGWLDEDGFLFLVGRRDDLMIVGGENIYPDQIERVIREAPGVLDVAVVGVPDPVLGERIVAYVVPHADTSTGGDDLLRHCAGRLPFNRLPRHLRFVTEIPRTATGKVRRWLLREPESGDSRTTPTGDGAGAP